MPDRGTSPTHKARPRTGYDGAFRVVYYKVCRVCGGSIKRGFFRGWKHGV